MKAVYLPRGFQFAAWMAAVALGFFGSQGCSGGKKGDPNGRIVTGTVTFNGSPVEGAAVTFVSPTVSAFGQTDAQGKFKLTTAGGEMISVGQYQVAIVKNEASAAANAPFDPEKYVPPDPNAAPAAAPKSLLPAKYGDAAKSELTATVTAEGKNEFDFGLSG